MIFPQQQVDIFKTLRQRVTDLARSLSDEEFFAIPNGFNNSIAWNVGHIFVTHQLLCYKLSNLPMHISDETCDLLKKGSTPREWNETPSREALIDPLVPLAEQFEKDAQQGVFKEFNTYTTSAGVELNNVETAFAFNCWHEGLHLGYVMALRRAL